MERKTCPQCGRDIGYMARCIQCSLDNELAKMSALSDDELNAKIDEVMADGKFDEDLCRQLIRTRNINTEKLADFAWERREIHFPEVYKDASDELVEKMIAELDKDDLGAIDANWIMICLAHKGGEKVLGAFRGLEENPREWRKKLHVEPSFYANYGGWTYDKDGKVIKTIFDKCFRIIRGTDEEAAQSPLRAALPYDKDTKCESCGSRLVKVIELDGDNEKLDFLGIKGKMSAVCCPCCLPFNSGEFSRWKEDGSSEVIPQKGYGTCEDEECEWIDELAENDFMLGGEVPVYFPCDWDTGSAVGGFAFWIDDVDIKTCPDCGKPMTYLAQLGAETLGFEGNIYIDICKGCKIAAMMYQQT